MHDVDRNSILYKDWEKKKYGQSRASGHSVHDQGNHHGDSSHAHRHNHEHEYGHAHAHAQAPHGHAHDHPETAYEDHFHDEHDHHGGRLCGDHLFTHLHAHEHIFSHAHHHTHDPEKGTWLHRVFKDPVRDWFSIAVMVPMILAGYFQWLPENLSVGVLVCAAVIGIFPALKNAFLASFFKRRPNLELVISLVLIVGLIAGFRFEVALCALFMLMGSFMRLDFSWKEQ